MFSSIDKTQFSEINRNRHRFVGLYRKSESLFSQLNAVLDIWMPWVALGQINLEDLCDIHLVTWNDWDKNFKACKHFSQQIAKIQKYLMSTSKKKKLS